MAIDLSGDGILRPGTRRGYNQAGSLGASQYENQIGGVFLPKLQQRLDADARARNAAMLDAIRQKPVYPDITPQAGLIPSTSGMTAGGPVRAVTLSKDPELEQDLLNILSDTRNTDFTTLTRQPRSSRLGDELGNAFARFRGSTDDATQSVRDFVEDFLSVRPEQKKLANTEIGTVNRILGSGAGSLSGDLGESLDRRMLGQSEVTKRLLNQLTRANKIRGTESSYGQREASRSAGDVLLQDALARQEMERRNLMDVASLQTNVLGRGDDILAQYNAQGLLPYQAQQALASGNIANLAGLGQVELGNTLLTRPADDLAQRLALLNAASQARRGIRYEGLEGQFNNVLPRAQNYSPLDPTSGIDVNELLAYLNEQGQGYPPLGTTSGSLSPQAMNPANEQQLYDLLNYQAEAGSGLPIDYGAGSPASSLGLPGTSRTNSFGQNFIMSPRTRGYLPVGPDGLTDEQRYYDTPNPLY